MVPKHDRGRPNANLPRLPALQLARHRVEVREKRLDEPKELLAGGRQLEWPPLKQRHPKILFQLPDLSAHRGLLNAVRNIAHRLRYSPMPRHVIEQFQMMNIHLTDS